MLNVVACASCQSPIESPIEPNTLHFVSDDELLFRTRELARHETELTIVTIQHLDEIERRGLYDTRGYPSLFEYAVRELHYSKGCAWRRIMVMKLCRAVPGIADKLRSGELNLTTASQLQNAIEKRARKAARGQASESVSVPAAGAVSAGAEESASGEVQPARTGVAGASAAVPPPAGVAPTGVGAAALGAVWAPVGAAATQGTVGDLAAGDSAAGGSAAVWESAAAVPLPAGVAATEVGASALLAPAQAGTAGAEPAAAMPNEPGLVPDETEAVRVAGKAAVAAPAAPAAAAASPTAGAVRESAALPSAAEPPPAWTLDQKVELVELVANKSARETEKLLAELEPEVGLPRERQRALGGGRYELRVILDQGSVDTIAKLKGWLSHVNPGFTTGQLLAYLLQQAGRKYDPMRERGRAQRGAAAPARHTETCEQHLGVADERRGTGRTVGVGVSKAGSSTCATGAPGVREGVSATGAASGSVAAGSVAAGAPAPGPAAAGSAAAGFPAAPPAAAGPSVALAGGSVQNRRARPVLAPGSEQRRDTTGSARNQRAQPVPGPGSEQDRHDTAGSAQNRGTQRVPAPGSEQRRDTAGAAHNQWAPLVPDRSGERTSHPAAGSAQNRGAQRLAAPGSEQDRHDTAGSAQNRGTQRVPAPGSEQRRDTAGAAHNQWAPLVPDRSGERTSHPAAGSVATGLPAPAPAAAAPSVALAGGSAPSQGAHPVTASGREQDRRDTAGSAQNRGTQRVPAPGSEQRRDTAGSAQNQWAPLVPGRSGERTPHHAAGSVATGFPAPAPAAAAPSVALAGGSAQNQGSQPVTVSGREQDRRDTPGSARNQPPPRAVNVRSPTDTEPHRGVRARLPEDGTAARPPTPESARTRRARRHIPAAVRRAVWQRYGGVCCYQDPLTGVTCGSTHLVQIDHIVPVAQGGGDDISNLRLRCAVHNRRRDPRCASYRSAPAAAGGRLQHQNASDNT